MNKHFEVIGVSAPGELLAEVEKNEGIAVKAIKMTREITPLKDLVAVWKLYRFFRQEQPAIVHTHTPKAGLLGMLAAWLANVPVRIHTVAGLPLMEAKGLRRSILNLVEKITYSFAHKVYPNSQRLKQIILNNRFCNSQKLRVIGNGSSNGINTQFFSPAEVSDEQKQALKHRLQIEDSQFIFCYIGRVVSDKGMNELVAVFNELQKKYSNLVLLLVGPLEPELDPLQSSTEALIKEHSGIRSVGYQNDVRPYLAINNAFVFPSYREGFPNVVMQAGCFNLPAIVTDINGCNEIIEHELNGLIVPVKDEDALSKAMERLLIDEQLRSKCAENARRMITERYEQHYVWDLLLNEYKALLSDSKALTQPVLA